MANTKSFNIEFLKRFRHLLSVLFPLPCRSTTVRKPPDERIYLHPTILILVILLNSIVLEFVIYYVGLLPSNYYTSLTTKPEERDMSAFRSLILRSFILVIINAILHSLSTLFSSILYVRCRTRIVLYLHSFYFTEQRYYHLLNTTQTNKHKLEDEQITYQRNRSGLDVENNVQSASSIQFKKSNHLMIDNPDQRIAQDVDALCRTLSQIIPLILISPFTIIYYIYRTWSVMGAYGPLTIIAFFLIWTCLNKIFISSVSRIIFQQNIFEGNFRFLHTQIRTYNEPIAFYNGGNFEHQRFDTYFLQTLTPILYRRSIQEYLLNLSTNLYDYIGSILNYLLLAFAIFVLHIYDNQPIEDLVAMISQTSFTTIYLIYKFSNLNDLADQLSIIAANTHRIQTFVEYMKDIDTTWKTKQSNEIMNENNQVLVIKNLSYSTPTDRERVLMKNLNLILEKGQHLLVTGDSGVGKTSLFRILRFLWPINMNGSFSYKTNSSYLLPQRPYFTNQSLCDELLYPHIENPPTTVRQRQIEQLLREWNLSHILNFVEFNVFKCPDYAWQDLLSSGELQRLSFLRLILRLSFNENNHQIDNINLVFLDEITSSVDINTEIRMYKYLTQQNITMISIGHRPTIRQYHRLELKLEENGRSMIENLQTIDEF